MTDPIYAIPDIHGQDALLDAALDFARATDATRLVLATAVDNREAHSLYHKHGWQLDTNFNHYVLAASGG